LYIAFPAEIYEYGIIACMKALLTFFFVTLSCLCLVPLLFSEGTKAGRAAGETDYGENCISVFKVLTSKIP